MTHSRLYMNQADRNEQFPDYQPTRNELDELLKDWIKIELEGNWGWFNTGSTGGREISLSLFAHQRIKEIGELLGDDENKIIEKEASDEFRLLHVDNMRLWQIFKLGNSKEWNKVQEENQQCQCAFEPEKPWAYAPNMFLTSSAFSEGDPIPKTYMLNEDCISSSDHCISPPLQWTGQPYNTLSFAITLHCLERDDACAHWVVYNIPHEYSKLEEGLPQSECVGDGILQGKVGPMPWAGEIGYHGPPVTDPFVTYQFNIFALDRMLDLPAGISMNELIDAIVGHVLDQGQLTVISQPWIDYQHEK